MHSMTARPAIDRDAQKQRYLEQVEQWALGYRQAQLGSLRCKSILTTQKTMRTAPTPPPQQTCENILIDDKTHNVEHNIPCPAKTPSSIDCSRDASN